jgi:protein O-mannosyl-transferase
VSAEQASPGWSGGHLETSRVSGCWSLRLLLLGLVVAACLPALRCGFIWDDDSYVTQNRTLRDLAGLGHMWLTPAATPQYYPLVHSTFWLEYHLWRLHPAGFHCVNILLHGLAAILLYETLARLRLPGAWLAAAIFAVHPIAVESVAWVTERKNVLSAVFYFASALAWLRFCPLEESAAPPSSRWKWYFLALLFFSAALLSKTVTCTLPVALLLARWWKTGRVRWVDARLLAPFFVLAAGFGYLTAWLEGHHVGAQGPAWALSPAQRVLIAGRALWFYAGKLAWPANLTFIYPRWDVNASKWWQWLFPVAALATMSVLWIMRSRIGRGPIAAVLFFAVTLGPALGFVNVYPMRYSFVADHFQYLAAVGLVTLFVAWACRWPRWAAGLLLAVLGLLTWRQCGIYKDSETLWRATLARSPRSTIARNNLSMALLEKGDIDESIQLSREVLALQPDDAIAENNLGYALLQKGQFDDAIAHCRRSLQLQPNDPESYYNVGQALLKKLQFSAAVTNFEMAVRLKPDYPAAVCNLGYALLQTGQAAAAAASYEKSIELDPNYALPHNDLGSILLRAGETNQALAHFQRAVDLEPSFAEARFNLGAVLLAQGRLDEALSQYEKVVELRPRLAQAHAMLARLAAAFAQNGRLDKAITTTEQALQLARAGREDSLAASLGAQLQSYLSARTGLQREK